MIHLLFCRTSPMSVPKMNSNQETRTRQRQESSSSVSVGSWQLISGTGSLRSQDSNIVVVNEYHQSHHQAINNNNNGGNNLPTASNLCSNHSSGSATVNNGSIGNENSTIVDEDCFTANEYFMRRERLNSVRTLFYNCYSSTIGYKFKNSPDTTALGSLLGNFAEKVGLTQRTPV
jgi:myotubularin-related protein 14